MRWARSGFAERIAARFTVRRKASEADNLARSARVRAALRRRAPMLPYWLVRPPGAGRGTRAFPARKNFEDRFGMAGHSQFKNIMFRKGAQDKKRGKVFTK
ncbi:MAG: hypothetical protein WB697_18955, partial [Stellaceae bacterium]